MLDFAYPHLLWLLLLLPVFCGLYVWMRRSRKKKIKIFGRPDILAALMPDVSPYKPLLKFVLALVALACLIIAAARPWGGIVNSNGKTTGMEVVIAVDASNSMLASATGNPDDASRMVTAKVMLERLIGNLTNDRVGLVMFAGEAYQLIPTSSDYASVKSFLNSISPEEMPSQGTDLEAAINVAKASFSKDKSVGKAIVLLTDVEDLDDSEAAIKAVKSAASMGIQVDVIGVGSSNEVTIPFHNGFFRDQSGNVVHTKLNAELGKQLAEAGKGVYVNAASGDALSRIQKQLRTVRQSSMSTGKFTIHDELYSYFVAAALLLLCIDACIGMGKNRWIDRIAFFRRGRQAVASRKAKKSK